MKKCVPSALAVFFLASSTLAAAPLLPSKDLAAAPEFPVVRVQSGDVNFRIGQLEEQIRTLNGRIEELGFQMLQMQEQMRQMQEDNEFRFQELEKNGGKRTDAGPAVTEPAMDFAGNSEPAPDVEQSTTASTTPALGDPPRNLGAVTFDQNGNLIGGIIEQATPAPEIAALSTPEDLYQAGYNHMLAGDYALAEQVFRDYVDVHPDGPQVADALFWLGESQFSQGRFDEAARTFLDGHKRFPDAGKGAETLLKLAMSLNALGNRETACGTFREVQSRYPSAPNAIKARVTEELARASC